MNDVLRCLESRRSCRSFRSEQLSEADLRAILRAGTFAPTGRGLQAPKIIVLQKPEDIARLEKMNAEILGAPEAHPFFGAPTVCVVLTRAEVSTAVEDGALVLGNMMNAAWSLGVGSCWVHRARQEFDSPAGEFRPAAPRKADYITRI